MTGNYLSFILLCFFAAIKCRMQEQKHYDDHQQQQFQQYAQHLADFVPNQSFEFQLEVGEQHSFIFWPQHNSKALRGMFYITSEDNNGLFVGCESQGQMQKTFFDKKIGVFNTPYSGGDMRLIFKSQLKKLKIYLSYEIIAPKKFTKTPDESENKTNGQLTDIIAKFNVVKNTLSGQQQLLKAIIHGQLSQNQKLRDQIQIKKFRLVLETVVLVISGVISLVLLKKKMKKGYQLIV